MRRFVAICAALCLAGCGTYQKYQPQAVNADGLFRDADAISTDTVSMANVPWREFFTDSCLRTLIDTGLVSNSDLLVAELRVHEAEATLRAARMAFLPALSFSPQGQLFSFDWGKLAKTYQLALSAEWEIDVSGRLAAAKRNAAATAAMYRDARQAVQTQLVATIANSYYSLLLLDAQLAVSRETLKSWEEVVRTLKVRKDVGEANEAAVTQAEANALSVENSISKLLQQIREQENSLSALVGQKPHAVERTTLEAQQFPERLGVGVPIGLLDNRPDVRQAERNVEAAFYATQAARAAFYPQVTLGGTLGWTNSDGSSIVNPGKWLANLLGSVAQSLFSRGSNRANLAVAQARQQETLVAFRQKLLDAGAEVNNALAQWQGSSHRIELCQQQVAHLRATVRSTTLLMQHSEDATYLEVLTAQQSLLSAELAEKQEMFSKIQGIISLYHALGGGR